MVRARAEAKARAVPARSPSAVMMMTARSLPRADNAERAASRRAVRLGCEAGTAEARVARADVRVLGLLAEAANHKAERHGCVDADRRVVLPG